MLGELSYLEYVSGWLLRLGVSKAIIYLWSPDKKVSKSLSTQIAVLISYGTVVIVE